MMWTLGLATSLILAFVVGLGLPGLWLGMAADELYRSFANTWRWKSGRWKTKTVV
jgi:Na+-driven multidrug efflux pump